jgi:hypothetical protein
MNKGTWHSEIYTGVFLWQNTPEHRSGSSFSEGCKLERHSGTSFSCHQYNEVRHVLLSYCSSFQQTSITPV